MKTMISLAIAAAAAIAASPATAENDVQVNADGSYRIAVSYDDLNLTTEAGKRTLHARVRGATKRVCGAQISNITEAVAASSCRNAINEAARPQIALAERAARAGIVVAEGR